jgi:iron complex transport system substrate-binding protein
MSRTLAACALALAMLLTGCSDAASTTTSTTTADLSPEAPFPRTVNGVVVPAAPQRIVSASATHTEILYALGAGDRIAAVDMFSDYPPETADKERIDAFNVNVEAVAALDPDLVILSFDPGEVAGALSDLGIPVLLFPTAPSTLEDAYAEIETVGAAIGSDEAAAGLVASIRSTVTELVARVPEGGDPPTYYHELDDGLYSITSGTFIGSIYALAGMQNIADPADDAGTGYPQLSAEYILDADPDFIFLADTVCCGQSAATVAERPGWDTLTAVREGRVIELDDSLASRWGPRIVEFLQTVVDTVYQPAG